MPMGLRYSVDRLGQLGSPGPRVVQILAVRLQRTVDLPGLCVFEINESTPIGGPLQEPCEEASPTLSSCGLALGCLCKHNCSKQLGCRPLEGR